MSCVPLAKVPGLIAEASAAVQCGDEEDAVLVLQLVVQLPLGQEKGAGTIRTWSRSVPGIGTHRRKVGALGKKGNPHQKNGEPAHPLSNLQEGELPAPIRDSQYTDRLFAGGRRHK